MRVALFATPQLVVKSNRAPFNFITAISLLGPTVTHSGVIIFDNDELAFKFKATLKSTT